MCHVHQTYRGMYSSIEKIIHGDIALQRIWDAESVDTNAVCVFI